MVYVRLCFLIDTISSLKNLEFVGLRFMHYILGKVVSIFASHLCAMCLGKVVFVFASHLCAKKVL